MTKFDRNPELDPRIVQQLRRPAGDKACLYLAGLEPGAALRPQLDVLIL